MDIETARDGATLAIAINRPERRNALTAAMYRSMAGALGDAAADPEVRVVLFHGLGGAFTAGNDLGDFVANPPVGDDPPVFAFLEAVAGFGKPLVAAVNGPAVGLGTTLLLHCDLVFAGDDARFALPFTRLGLVPEFGSSYLLPLVAGYQRAAELLLLGEPFDAQRAYEAGFVTRVLPAAEALDAAREACRKLAGLPPKSIALTRSLMKQAHRDAILAQIRAEGAHFRTLLSEPAAQQAFAAFLARK